MTYNTGKKQGLLGLYKGRSPWGQKKETYKEICKRILLFEAARPGAKVQDT